ncbi:MAG: ABC transporter ATP-binding protein [Desulfobacula sp.]|nr:ABC transporter ATP-binding protein [Desulfobacula sp.]
MTEPVIEIKNLSKAYQIYSKPSDMIIEMITGRTRHDLYWALKDISFSIKEKQRIGIIGPNGSGKSTLLKLITENLTPTSGTITVNGKISAMLALASSLNPEEDGISNIRFNLLMNGCNPKIIPSLTEDIIEFTELGPFIYSPVKTYSTGMNARLSFGITTAMKPEILVVDEILSVGDGYFMGKAMNRMIKLCDTGKALIFVSHSVSDVRKLCDTALWLENGSVRKLGPVEKICGEYEEDYTKKRDASERIGNREKQKNIRIGSVAPGSFDSPGLQRLRIVPEDSEKEFSDIHYIRNIQLDLDDNEQIKVPMEFCTLSVEQPSCLDVLGSEWGRFYNRHGADCRLLFANTGKSHGGHLLFHPGEKRLENKEIKVSCSFLASSHSDTEKLVIEYLDCTTVSWQRAGECISERHGTHWERVSASFAMPLATAEQIELAKEVIAMRAKPDVEIIDVAIYSDDEQAVVVKERQPFDIRVTIRANRLVERADVTICLYKSDGTYVFWQSSGMNPDNIYDTSQNIFNLEGTAEITFRFEQNLLNEGKYEIHVACANGFDITYNNPQSEQYDIKIGFGSLVILKEFSEQNMDFGQLNMRVPVDVYIIGKG